MNLELIEMYLKEFDELFRPPHVKAKPLRGGWVCALVRRCRLRKSRDINFEKAGWISFSMALNQGVQVLPKVVERPGLFGTNFPPT